MKCKIYIHPIKAIQLVKHPVGAVWRQVFCRMTCRLGTFLLFLQYVWMLNFFLFLLDLHTSLQFWTNFQRKIEPSTYIRKYTVSFCKHSSSLNAKQLKKKNLSSSSNSLANLMVIASFSSLKHLTSSTINWKIST